VIRVASPGGVFRPANVCQTALTSFSFVGGRLRVELFQQARPLLDGRIAVLPIAHESRWKRSIFSILRYCIVRRFRLRGSLFPTALGHLVSASFRVRDLLGAVIVL